MPINADGTWSPECWHMSNVELQNEAKRMNAEAFSIAFAQAGKHSQPDQHFSMRPY